MALTARRQTRATETAERAAALQRHPAGRARSPRSLALRTATPITLEDLALDVELAHLPLAH